MTIEEILEEWKTDSVIDRCNIQNEILKITELHFKYWKILYNEKVLLENVKAEYNKLYKETYEFYIHGASEAKDLKRSAKGAVLKTEAEIYIQADEHIIKMSMKLAKQKEKTEFVKAILESIKSRGYNLKVVVDHIKFEAGS